MSNKPSITMNELAVMYKNKYFPTSRLYTSGPTNASNDIRQTDTQYVIVGKYFNVKLTGEYLIAMYQMKR